SGSQEPAANMASTRKRRAAEMPGSVFYRWKVPLKDQPPHRGRAPREPEPDGLTVRESLTRRRRCRIPRQDSDAVTHPAVWGAVSIAALRLAKFDRLPNEEPHRR